MSAAGIAGGLVALATDALYLWIVLGVQSGEGDETRIALVASAIAAAGVLAIVGAALRDLTRRALALGFASAALLVLGVLGVFSVGAPLLVACLLVWSGSLRATLWLGRRAVTAVVVAVPAAAASALILLFA